MARSQHLGVEHGRVGLAEGDAAGLGEFGHLGQALAGEVDGERADRIDVGELGQARAVLEHFDQARLVERRVGVGRAGEAGDAAGRGGRHFRFERGLVFEARLAQPRRKVDQAGADDAAGGVDGGVRLEAGRRRAANADYLALGDEDIGGGGRCRWRGR